MVWSRSVLVIGLTLRHMSKTPAKKPAKGRGRSGSRSPVTLTSVQLHADRWIAKAERAQRSLESRIKTSGGRSKVDLPRLLDQRDDAAERLSAAQTLRSTAPEDLASMAGAFVLARQAHRPPPAQEVLPPCFFDPTHQSGTVQASWSDGTEVPACPACAKLLDRGETPPGFRLWKKAGLFRLDAGAVPYWTLDPSEHPLLATGFGALEDDLVERVKAGNR